MEMVEMLNFEMLHLSMFDFDFLLVHVERWWGGEWGEGVQGGWSGWVGVGGRWRGGEGEEG